MVKKMATMTLNMRQDYMDAVDKMAEEQGLSKTQLVICALRFYQVAMIRFGEGETMSFSGDPARHLQFIGPGFDAAQSKDKA